MKQVTNQKDYKLLDELLQSCKDRMDELKASSVLSKKEMQELDQAADNLKNVLGNINGASLNELTAAAASLQQKLGDIKPDSTAYHETAENISKIRSRIKQLGASQKDVNLTIDKDIQKSAEKNLEKGIKATSTGGAFTSKYGNYVPKASSKCESGATVVLDVSTGDVLGMASYPDFNPNLFATGISSEDWKSN